MTMRGPMTFSHTFQEMATSAGLMGSEVHKVQEGWTGQKDPWAGLLTTQQKVPKGHLVFPDSASNWIAWDHGTEGNPFPKALHRQVGLSFCLWCGKEGQNEGTVVNHLWISHYHLSLICSWYQSTLQQVLMLCTHHSQLCKPAPAGIDNNNDDKEEESDTNDNGEDDFMFS